jgi:outer membrane protein assembly factor BamB
VRWKLKTSSQAVGIHVDAKHVWAANDAGEIFVTDRDGAVQRSHRLPDAVRCLIADEDWCYAGCNDGNVYDLTGRVPRVTYAIGRDVDWLSVYRGNLVVADDEGGLTVLDAMGALRWEQSDPAYGAAWLLCANGSRIFHGGAAGIRALDWKGKVLWTLPGAPAHFGWVEGEVLVAIDDDQQLQVIDGDGEVQLTCVCRSTAKTFKPNGSESCTASPDGERLFGASGGWIFCFDREGKALWEAPTKCGSACSMHFADGLLHAVTTNGSLLCIDVDDAAIARARKGQLPRPKRIAAPRATAAAARLEETTDSTGGVVVECFKQGGQLHVRVASPGFKKKWRCQFPRDVREEGARYVVAEVREASQGGFYRALGDIRRLR